MHSNSISVRLDKEAMAALRQLESAGCTRSEAIRKALIGAAESHRRRKTLKAEVAALEADEQDCDEMRQVAGLMEQLRAPR